MRPGDSVKTRIGAQHDAAAGHEQRQKQDEEKEEVPLRRRE